MKVNLKLFIVITVIVIAILYLLSKFFDLAWLLTAVIIVTLGLTLILLYAIYRVLLKAKFYSGVWLVSFFMIDRLLRGLGRFYTSTVDTPPLLDNPDNTWLRTIITSNVVYSVISTAMLIALGMVLADIVKRFRFVTTRDIIKEENKEMYVPEKVVGVGQEVTIIKEEGKDV